jgi:hypothetical protein
VTLPSSGWRRSDRFNRPVVVPVAAPAEAPPPSAPLRVRLGDVVRVPGRCIHCGRAVSPSRAATATRCARCIGTGRPCRGCGAPIRGKIHYCATCRETRCHNCYVYAGQHTPSCPWRLQRACMTCGGPIENEGRRRRLARCAACRPASVTADEFAAAYLEAQRRALRVARWLVGEADAQDLVQHAALSLWAALDGLHFIAPEVVVQTVKWRALHWQRTWKHAPVPMNPEQMVALEEMQEGQRRGVPDRYGWVRLDEPA